MDGAEAVWTTANLLKLVGRIRSNTPESEKTTSYQMGLLSVNWDRTAFPPYSAKECHDKWQKVLKKMRKLRSMSELVAEAEEMVSNPLLHRRDGLPVKPPLDGKCLFIKENAAENKTSLGSDFFSEMKKRWTKLNAAEKHEYYIRCLKMKHEYNAKLKEYLDRFDETEKQQFIKENDIRFLKVKPVPVRTRSPREPKMPSQNLLTYFAKSQKMSSAKSKKLWHKLPIKEKERYKEHKRLKLKQYSENLQKWFKELTPEEQMKYLKQNPNKLQFLDAPKNLVNEREELCLSQPSDSEDEDITEISSEDDIWSSYEDESDEDCNMFEMHR